MGIPESILAAFPPKPKLTERELPDLQGKVYIVTGGNGGVGKELARILYLKHAKVYVAGRSQEKLEQAISQIKESTKDSKGQLVSLKLDLADLSSIKASAQQFLDNEDRLDVLFNNAGVMTPPKGSLTAQGYDLQLGVNNMAPQLFTKFLTPTLIKTAKTEPTGTVRVVWVSSSAAEAPFVPPGGVDMSNLDYHRDANPFVRYCISKAINYLQGAEYARRLREAGVVSVALNPGNLDSELWRYRGPAMSWFLRTFILHPSVYGAYTEIFAGLSSDITPDKSGAWVAPWGRFAPIRKDLLQATKSKEEGGTEVARQFWGWCEQETSKFE